MWYDHPSFVSRSAAGRPASWEGLGTQGAKLLAPRTDAGGAAGVGRTGSGRADVLDVDFLVVGGGLAGLYTALQLADRGRCLVVSKADLDISNSAWAQGGIAVALDAEDDPALHVEDTLRAGRGLSKLSAVRILASEGPDRIHELLDAGVPFDRDAQGRPSLGLEGGHGRRRIVHANGGATGLAVVRALLPKVLGHPRITVWENTRLLVLAAEAGTCRGALVQTPEGPRHVRARATVLATGGAGGLFARTTNPPSTAGDGIALAYLAGAAVADLEFMQFHPTAFAQGKPAFLLSEALRGEGAQLWNLQGERFMARYDAAGELAPRDVVARAITAEMAATGTDHVQLRLDEIGAEARQHFSSLLDGLRARGFDPMEAGIPVAPAAHYLMGGVAVDLDGHSSLGRLYAVGEAACTGVHGANRLASNSLLECLVFGHRVAAAAAEEPPADTLPADLPEPVRQLGPAERQLLGAWLFEDLGILRSHAGFARLRERLTSLPPSLEGVVASLMAAGAERRRESRGSHFRSDYPREDPALAGHLVTVLGGDPRLEFWS